jgi:hypothetical protein
MTDWPLPPYVEPHGPEGDDAAVVAAFLAGDIPPHSARLHVEGPVLMADRDVPLALRLSPTAALLRVDLSEAVAEVRRVVEGVLTAEGLRLLDEESPLGIAVGVQLVGLRASTWDLWGTDIDEAFAALREAAVGGPNDIILGGGSPPPPGF